MKVTIEQLKEMINNNECVSDVDTSEITHMCYLFKDNKAFNQDISKWNVSNVTNMESMFFNSVFNVDISIWNVSKVQNMSCMFTYSKFNKKISTWNVSKVTNMSFMFSCSEFNNDISIWNLSNVNNINQMLYCNQFNQNIFNLKGILENKTYSKNMKFIKNNLVVGVYK